MTNSHKRCLYALWILSISCFALLHALHLSADFPNHTPWFSDWAKYTDEGWYGNAAIRAHLFGNWYIPGDFNPAPAVPLWPFLEWILFFVTGVTLEAARGLAVGFFLANLLLGYLLLRVRGSHWMALLALTLMVTSPFLYCFSRLAILEPMLTTLTLAALNLAVRLPRIRRPIWASACIGVLFTLMMFTKTTAVFLLPALGWAMILALWQDRKLALRSTLAAVFTFATTFGLWIALVAHWGLLADYKYLFFINKYNKPKEFYWPIISLWWSFHGGLWVDRILIPLTGLVTLGLVLAGTVFARRNRGARQVLLDPVFGACVWAVAGYILFMTYQNHPQPRYFAIVALFSFFIVALGAEALVKQGAENGPEAENIWSRRLGYGVVTICLMAAAANSLQMLSYVAHPEYTFIDAAQGLTRYIDQHPNGKRLLVSISGDQITLATHLPTLCDDFGTPSPTYPDLATRLNIYQPGWYATWNDFDPGTLEDIHTHFSIEQVASFRAFDDPERNLLVLFKLHPLPGGKARNPGEKNLQIALPDDKIEIPIE